jgi:hypothetical protein
VFSAQLILAFEIQTAPNKANRKIPVSQKIQDVSAGLNILIAKFAAVANKKIENTISSSKRRFFSVGEFSVHNFSEMIWYKGLFNAVKIEIMAIKQSYYIKNPSYKVLINFDFKKVTFVLFLPNCGLIV